MWPGLIKCTKSMCRSLDVPLSSNECYVHVYGVYIYIIFYGKNFLCIATYQFGKNEKRRGGRNRQTCQQRRGAADSTESYPGWTTSAAWLRHASISFWHPNWQPASRWLSRPLLVCDHTSAHCLREYTRTLHGRANNAPLGHAERTTSRTRLVFSPWALLIHTTLVFYVRIFVMHLFGVTHQEVSHFMLLLDVTNFESWWSPWHPWDTSHIGRGTVHPTTWINAVRPKRGWVQACMHACIYGYYVCACAGEGSPSDGYRPPTYLKWRVQILERVLVIQHTDAWPSYI